MLQLERNSKQQFELIVVFWSRITKIVLFVKCTQIIDLFRAFYIYLLHSSIHPFVSISVYPSSYFYLSIHPFIHSCIYLVMSTYLSIHPVMTVYPYLTCFDKYFTCSFPPFLALLCAWRDKHSWEQNQSLYVQPTAHQLMQRTSSPFLCCSYMADLPMCVCTPMTASQFSNSCIKLCHPQRSWR